MYVKYLHFIHTFKYSKIRESSKFFLIQPFISHFNFIQATPTFYSCKYICTLALFNINCSLVQQYFYNVHLHSTFAIF